MVGGGQADFASLLLQNLRPDDPWVPPRKWEEIASESGGAAATAVARGSMEPYCDPLVVSEATLVRLVLNALQGVKSALDGIEVVSALFCSSSADRTFHRVPNMWYRSSSMNTLGRLLKSIGRSGQVFFLLRKFVGYFLGMEQILKAQCQNKGMSNGNQIDNGSAEKDSKPRLQGIHKDELGEGPPYTLVNQAFAVAVGKILEGYICALNTVFASVKCRRSWKNIDKLKHISFSMGSLTSVLSEITLLEVYLHTKELRTRIEALGNICGLRINDLAFYELSGEGFSAKIKLEFDSFPRGADLLTYLYVQLRGFGACATVVVRVLINCSWMPHRPQVAITCSCSACDQDADPIHHSLLKFLFVRSCEPYCCFIQSWIYEAKINDPYKEFIVEYLEKSSHVRSTSSNFMKERDRASVPCFLEDVCSPLLRAGQQLQVLMKLLDLCSPVSGEHNYGQVNVYCDLTSLQDVLPHWTEFSSDSVPHLSLLTFSDKGAEAMIKKRENIYRMMYTKFQSFFKRLDVRYQPIKQMAFGHDPFHSDERDNKNSQVSLVTDEILAFSPASIDEATYVDAGFKGTDASSTSDGSSYCMDTKQTSENSSFIDSELDCELEESSDLHDIAVGQNNVPGSASPTCYSIKSTCQSLYGSENSWASVFDPLLKPEFTPKKCIKSDSVKAANLQNVDLELNLFSDPSQSDHPKKCMKSDSVKAAYSQDVDVDLNLFSDPSPSDHPRCTRLTKTFYEDSLFEKSWPLGGLSKNPFYASGKSECQEEFLSSGTNENMKTFETENSTAGVIYTLDNFKLELTTRTANQSNLYNGYITSAKKILSRSWDSHCKYDLSVNTVLRKAAWLGNLRYNRPFFPYCDFSSVEDPCEFFSEMLSQSGHGLQDQRHVPVNSTSLDVNEYMSNDVSVPQVDECGSDSDAASSRRSDTNQLLGDVRKNVSGGANWEALLRCSVDDVQPILGGTDHGSVMTCDLPLDVVIDKCIVQGILHQYVYISNFTIKLLEEGFDLHEHLLALRRYHFMEFADWADSFVVSLWNHKWFATEPSNLSAEIQRLLVVALQRSSCESDPYHERLYIHAKEQCIMPLSFSAIGTFNFIGLGYKVDWPITIILTQDALNVYSEIFSFLLQVRLAVFSLSSVWSSLKALVHCISSRLYSGGREMEEFNFFLKIRQQVNHFVSTLQQYLQSQLSDVSWCRFLHSLKHQVNDVFDLESVHMSYLADAQNICFLSVETKTIATIIKAILQCALDFRACFTDSIPLGQEGPYLSFLFGQINFPKALAIKETFGENMKDLYLCYLKSPKHSEFSLCRFWSYLDYNGYFSKDIIQGMSF